MTGRAVVVGAGIAGLASAALLAREGYDVEVIERADAVGGRAGLWDRDGFRFDTGPSWYLMPEVFDHFFALMGTSTAAELDLVALDPAYQVLTEGSAAPTVVRTDSAAALFEELESGAGAALTRYLASARRAYDLALRHFLYTTWRDPRPLLRLEILRGLPELAGLMTSSLERYIGRRFRDTRLRQVLGYPAVFLGTSPDRAPALYHLMSHVDLADGVRYPLGGLTTVIAAVERVARAHGVRITTGTEATRVLTSGPGRPRVTGVEVSDATGTRTLPADLVVGAGDLHHLETRMLPRDLQTYPESWWRRRDPGFGAVLLYLGVRGRLPRLEHHTLLFTQDWDANFRAIFGADRHVPDPTSMYVCTPSRTDPSVAPDGDENVFVLIPVPADRALGRGGVDRTGAPALEAVADAAIAQIAAWAGIPDLAERITVRRTVGPADFAADLHAWSGTALGPAHTLRQSALMRGRNSSRRVRGLFYAGGSTIPGIGLPMCLISAEILLKAVRGDTSAGPLPEPTAPLGDPAR